jgi:protein-tyrosine phosphatase
MYWVRKKEIGGSPLPYTIDEIKEWKAKGVKRVLVLPEEWEIEEAWGTSEYYFSILRDNNLDFIHIPIPDNYPPTISQFNEIYEWLNKGKGNLVHCVGGIGRTGTIIAAYLIMKEGYEPNDAVEEVRKYREGAVQSLQQFEFLMKLFLSKTQR